jgi:hypothetical protein
LNYSPELVSTAVSYSRYNICPEKTRKGLGAGRTVAKRSYIYFQSEINRGELRRLSINT